MIERLTDPNGEVKRIIRFDCMDVVSKGLREFESEFGIRIPLEYLPVLSSLIDYGISLRYNHKLSGDFINHYLFSRTNKLLLNSFNLEEDENMKIGNAITILINNVLEYINLSKESKFIRFWLIKDMRQREGFYAFADFLV